VARWALHFVDGRWLHILWLLVAIAFFAFTAAVLLRQALGDSVTRDTIAGAICVYLLLGVVWAFTFNLIEVTHPGSFLVGGQPLGTSAGVRQSSIPEFFYLSFITLSTVGYGDVLPATPPARMIAALEGIAGQLYLAVLIARLVGIRASRAGPGA
jgi:Ion channel